MNLLVVKSKMLNFMFFQDFFDLRDLGRFEQAEDRPLLCGRQNRQDVGCLARGHLADELGHPFFAERENDVALHGEVNLFQSVGSVFGIETLKNADP